MGAQSKKKKKNHHRVKRSKFDFRIRNLTFEARRPIFATGLNNLRAKSGFKASENRKSNRNSKIEVRKSKIEVRGGAFLTTSPIYIGGSSALGCLTGALVLLCLCLRASFVVVPCLPAVVRSWGPGFLPRMVRGTCSSLGWCQRSFIVVTETSWVL